MGAQKAGILLAMAVLVGGSMLQQRASGRQWPDVFLHGATAQWLAVVILLGVQLTLVDIGLGAVGLILAILVALGYLMGAAGWLGGALQSVIESTWGQQPTPTVTNPGVPR